MVNNFADQTSMEYARRILVGKEIMGVRFGHDIALLINGRPCESGYQGQAYLTLGSPWTILKHRPLDSFGEDWEFSKQDMDQQILMAATLAEKCILEVEIDARTQNLLIETEGSFFLLVSGKNNGFDAWHIGMSDGTLEIVCQDGGLCIMNNQNGE